jgi:nicotinate-nucleotide adenylyltransferase
MAPAATAKRWWRLAIAGEPRFVLDRRETERSGPTYTLDTVRELQAEQPGADWFFIIGQDQYAGLHTWRDWQELAAAVTLAVANRAGPPPTADRRGAASAAPGGAAAHAGHLRHRHPPARGCRRLRGISHLVPAEVARYIDQHGLYRAMHTPTRS